LVRGFHTPALKRLTGMSFTASAVARTCSLVSALQGPAIIKGSLANGRKDIGCKGREKPPPNLPQGEASRREEEET
jgi:hypothetical protein